MKETDWHLLLEGNRHEATQKLTDYLLETAKVFVPKRVLKQRKSTHPWVNERCRKALEALEATQAVEGSEEHKEAVKTCDRAFQEERQKYEASLKEKLRALPKGSKRWWRLNRELLHSAPCRHATPSLKNALGSWVHDPAEKANLFSETFQQKSTLPKTSEFYEPTSSAKKMSSFTAVRKRWAFRFLKNLEVDTATGPD